MELQVAETKSGFPADLEQLWAVVGADVGADAAARDDERWRGERVVDRNAEDGPGATGRCGVPVEAVAASHVISRAA